MLRFIIIFCLTVGGLYPISTTFAVQGFRDLNDESLRRLEGSEHGRIFEIERVLEDGEPLYIFRIRNDATLKFKNLFKACFDGLNFTPLQKYGVWIDFGIRGESSLQRSLSFLTHDEKLPPLSTLREDQQIIALSSPTASSELIFVYSSSAPIPFPQDTPIGKIIESRQSHTSLCANYMRRLGAEGILPLIH